jgi:hypothetical protein
MCSQRAEAAFWLVACPQVEAGWLATSCLEALCESRDDLAAAAVECPDDSQGDIDTVRASYIKLNSSSYVQQQLLTTYNTTGGCCNSCTNLGSRCCWSRRQAHTAAASACCCVAGGAASSLAASTQPAACLHNSAPAPIPAAGSLDAYCDAKYGALCAADIILPACPALFQFNGKYYISTQTSKMCNTTCLVELCKLQGKESGCRWAGSGQLAL